MKRVAQGEPNDEVEGSLRMTSASFVLLPANSASRRGKLRGSGRSSQSSARLATTCPALAEFVLQLEHGRKVGPQSCGSGGSCLRATEDCTKSVAGILSRALDLRAKRYIPCQRRLGRRGCDFSW